MKQKEAATPPEVRTAYVENWAAESEALRERLIFLCESRAPARGRYDYLESRTGIAASRWKNVFLERQMPTIEMLVALCHYRRDHALWLMTGSAAGDGGLLPSHRAPGPEEWHRFTMHRAWLRERKDRGDQEG